MKKFKKGMAIILSFIMMANVMTVFADETTEIMPAQELETEEVTDKETEAKEVTEKETETEEITAEEVTEKETETEEITAKETGRKEVISEAVTTKETRTKETETKETGTKEIETEESKTEEKDSRRETIREELKENLVETPPVMMGKPMVQIWGSQELYLYGGSVYSLSAQAYNTNSKLKWKSSDKNIVTVDKKGNIKAKKPGTAKVYAYVKGAKKYFKIKVCKNHYKLNFSSKKVMKGTAFKLSVANCQNASFNFEDTGNREFVSITSATGSQCTVKALKSGRQNIIVTAGDYNNGHYVIWRQKCKVNVIYKGIKEQDISIAEGTTKKLHLRNVSNNAEIKKTVWKSSDSRIAVAGSGGIVKGKSKGAVKISAVITYTNGKVKKYSTSVKVSAPKLSRKSMNMTTGAPSKIIRVWGCNNLSTIRFKSNRASTASVTREGLVTPVSKGSAIIRVFVDGRVLKCRVTVSDPRLEKSNVMLAPGNTSKIKVNGIIKNKSRVKYKSNNTGVATVDSKGKVTAHNYGRAEITVTADGRKLRFLVESAPQRAIDAARKAVAIKSVSTYSQENRMSDGFYDCSSLVFKAYDYDSGLLGGTPAWAPTAANMAKHMADTGKVIAYENINLNDLRPGDLVFQGGADNGRYMGIYHVEMYCGGEDYWFFNIVMVARPIP